MIINFEQIKSLLVQAQQSCDLNNEQINDLSKALRAAESDLFFNFEGICLFIEKLQSLPKQSDLYSKIMRAIDLQLGNFVVRCTLQHSTKEAAQVLDLLNDYYLLNSASYEKNMRALNLFFTEIYAFSANKKFNFDRFVVKLRETFSQCDAHEVQSYFIIAMELFPKHHAADFFEQDVKPLEIAPLSSTHPLITRTRATFYFAAAELAGLVPHSPTTKQPPPQNERSSLLANNVSRSHSYGT